MANFQETYVKIAEATASSRDLLTDSVEPMSDTADYNSTGLSGNVKTVVDVQTSGEAGDFDESTISEITFELQVLSPANSAWGQVRDVSTSNAPYLGLVTAINDYVVNFVLGEATTNPTSIGGVYQSTLQGFLDIDCVWDSEPSAAGAPTSWITLMQAAGYDVVDTVAG